MSLIGDRVCSTLYVSFHCFTQTFIRKPHWLSTVFTCQTKGKTESNSHQHHMYSEIGLNCLRQRNRQGYRFSEGAIIRFAFKTFPCQWLKFSSFIFHFHKTPHPKGLNWSRFFLKSDFRANCQRRSNISISNMHFEFPAHPLPFSLTFLYAWRWPIWRMASPSDQPLLFYPTLPSFPSPTPGLEADSNVTLCQEWEQTHHLLFHLGNLSLLLGLVIPTTLGLHMILLRLLLMTGQSVIITSCRWYPCDLHTAIRRLFFILYVSLTAVWIKAAVNF